MLRIGAGIEIMTPGILAHRDASNLAVPRDQFPNPPEPDGIAIAVRSPGGRADRPSANTGGRDLCILVLCGQV